MKTINEQLDEVYGTPKRERKLCCTDLSILMKSKYQEVLDKRRFFNQRAARELWNDKPTDVQNKDIESAERDYDILQELIDKYSNFNKDKSCEIYCDTKALLEEEISILKERNSELEKYCDELEKKYNLAIKLISGLEAICPVSITKNCDDFEKCTECLDCFIQTEVERDKDE